MAAGRRRSRNSGPSARGDERAANPDDHGLIGYLLRPARHLIRRQLDRVERLLLGEIQHVRNDLQTRLHHVHNDDGAGDSVPHATAPLSHAGSNETPADIMRVLLERSANQSQEECETAYFFSVLSILVPDEARILSALSDGAAHPLLHVLAGSRFGTPARQVVGNVSDIGRVAGVQWTDETATYVTRLQHLGLVETGPEAPSLLVRYQILETDSTITTAVEHIRTIDKQRVVIVRRSLKISRLGKSLWDACAPSGDRTQSAPAKTGF